MMDRCSSMRTLLAITGYLAIACLIIVGASEGARWLVTPDPAQATSKQPVARQIPPRIAESIERKKVFVRQPAPEPLVNAPAMTEAPVSLPTTQQIRIREVRAPKSRRHRSRTKPVGPAAESRSNIATSIVRGRSDNPYD
jgi:hypothetical protein